MVFNPVIFTGGDNGYYIGLSHSIIEEFSYNTYWKVGTPPETSIPPGYPLILAIIQLIFGDSLIPMKIFSLLCYFIALFFIYRILQLFDVNRFIAGGAVLFMALSPVLNEYSHWVLTEAPFLCFAAIGIYILEKYLRRENKELILLILSAVIISFAVYIRIPALTILPAVFFYIWLKKDMKKALIFAAIVFVILLPWGLRVVLTPNPDGNLYYQNIMQEKMGTGEDTSTGVTGLILRIPEHFWKYATDKVPALMIPQRFYTSERGWIDIFIGGFITFLILIGIYYSFKKKQYFSSLFIIFTFALLFINHSVRIRYLIILFPFMIHVISRGAEFIFYQIKKEKFSDYIMAGLLFIIIIFATIEYLPNARNNLQIMKKYAMGQKFAGLHPVYLRYFETAKWVKNNTPEDALIIARKPRLFYVLSGRKSDIFKKNENKEVVINDILERDIDYLIIDRILAETGYYLIPAIESRNDIFKAIYKTAEPENYIIKVIKENK
ncbi:MAG: ArnT family glycosyltransferase [Candidatus Zixiibacteriota bacterium]